MSKAPELSNRGDAAAGDGGRESRIEGLLGPASGVAAIVNSLTIDTDSPDPKAGQGPPDSQPEIISKILLKKYGHHHAYPTISASSVGPGLSPNQRAPAPIQPIIAKRSIHLQHSLEQLALTEQRKLLAQAQLQSKLKLRQMAALHPDVQERVVRASQSLNETLQLSTGAREGAEGDLQQMLHNGL